MEAHLVDTEGNLVMILEFIVFHQKPETFHMCDKVVH